MEALIPAIAKGEEGTITRLLDEDPGLLERLGQNGHRPLIKAAAHGWLKVVKLLLQRGAEVNGTGPEGTTALYWAADYGHEEMATFLLSNGADANIRDTYGRLPLFRACWEGHLGVVRVLLQHMGELVLQATDDRGKTALHWAAFMGREEVATFLLSHGANANRRDTYGMVPLIVASWKGHLGVVRVLLQHTGAEGLEETDKEGRTALYWAVKEGHADVAAYLLSEGAHADSRNDLDKTPLMSACSKGHLGVVRVLLQHTGAQGLEELDEEGRTALHFAAFGGNEKVVCLLLENGADVNRLGYLNRTPLMSACVRGHVGVVRVLLQHMGGQELHATDVKGRTALHWAADDCNEEVVRLLLCAGADPTTTDLDGWTARALAEGERGWIEDRRADCIAVFQWWEGELERRYALSKAICLHKASARRRDKPTCGVPTFLEARLPTVEVVSLQSLWRQKKDQAGASGKRKAAGEGGSPPGADVGEEERHAVLSYVLKGLNEELLTELLEGFHS